MARYSAAQIYAAARAGGFDPDEAVTMTAIALAESGGRTSAHNSSGEDSRGLWQINARAHPDLAARYDLWDPRGNAMAAFQVSGGGRDMSPWTTTHGGSRAAYTRFRADAQAAAAAYGEPQARGVWTGTTGYGDHQPAGGDGTAGDQAAAAASQWSGTEQVGDSVAPPPSGHHGIALADADVGATPPGPGHHGVALADAGADAAVTVPGDVGGVTGADGGVTPPSTQSGYGTAPAGVGGAAVPSEGSGDGGRLHEFLSSALAQKGDQYIYGAVAGLNDPDPKAFDCSMLVEWSAHQAGVDLPRNAWQQYRYLHQHGMVIPVDQAIHTPGALLFSFDTDPNGGDAPGHQHVAISLGDGKTIEARGRAYGVGSFDATTQRFDYAAVIPGISGHVDPVGTPAPVSYAEPHSAVSTDDGGSAPAGMTTGAVGFPSGGRLLDTDGDGLGDRLERRMGLDPHNADTDGDLLSDSFELLFSGTDPLVADATDDSWNAQLDNVLLSSDGPGPADHAHDPGGTAQPPALSGLSDSANGGFNAGHDETNDHISPHGIAIMPDGFDHAGQPDLPDAAHHLNDTGHVSDWGSGDDDDDGPS